MKNYIMVIDCNNFFASCERLFRPDLEEKPVLVLSSNDGCVVARSQEVKDMGVPMGVPFFQIKDIIKDKAVTVFSGNHTTYRNISKRVMQVIIGEGYISEQYSIDEAFIIYSSNSAVEALNYARYLQKKIKQWVGIPVSVGVGFSKTQAKLASEQAKKTKDGVFFVDKNWCLETGADISIGTVWGIGRRLSTRYRQFGLSTLSQLIQASVATLQKIGGVVAIRQQAELADQLIFKVGELQGPQKSLMSSQTFGAPTANKSAIYSAIAHHVRNVAEELQRKQLVTDAFQVYVRPKDRDLSISHWRPVYLPELTNGNVTILKAVLADLEAELDTSYLYNKVGILALNTRPAAMQNQGQLFASENNQTSEKLDGLLLSIGKRYGKKALKVGSFSKATSWQAKHLAQSPQYLTDWSEIPKISST